MSKPRVSAYLVNVNGEISLCVNRMYDDDRPNEFTKDVLTKLTILRLTQDCLDALSREAATLLVADDAKIKTNL